MDDEAAEPLEEAKKEENETDGKERERKKEKRKESPECTHTCTTRTDKTDELRYPRTQASKGVRQSLTVRCSVASFSPPAAGCRRERGSWDFGLVKMTDEVVRQPAKKSSAEAMQPDATTRWKQHSYFYLIIDFRASRVCCCGVEVARLWMPAHVCGVGRQPASKAPFCSCC